MSNIQELSGEIRTTLTLLPINWDTTYFSSLLDCSKRQTMNGTHRGVSDNSGYVR